MIGVVDFGAGNTRSVLRALAAVAADACLVRRPTEIGDVDRLILPGVGAAGSAMAALERAGLVEPLRAWGRAKRPLLGVCLGAQLLLDASDEDASGGLGLIRGRARAFPPATAGGPRRVPHVGWNAVELTHGGSFEAYFVHGYWLDPADPAAVVGWTEVDGFRFASLVRRGPLLGAQFHPEKSGPAGRALLAAFAAGDGRWS